MSEKVLVPVTQQIISNIPIPAPKPLIVTNFAKRLFTLQRPIIYAKPPPSVVITSQPQQIHSLPLFLNKQAKPKTKCTSHYFKLINKCARDVNK